MPKDGVVVSLIKSLTSLILYGSVRHTIGELMLIIINNTGLESGQKVTRLTTVVLPWLAELVPWCNG